MEPLLDGEDHANFQESVKEAAALSGVRVILQRYVSTAADGTFDGKSPTVTRKNISALFRVYQVSQKDILDSGGVYVAGDLKTHSLCKVQGYDNAAANLKNGDRLLYLGSTYVVLGSPNPVPGAGGRVFTQAFWRKS